MFIAFTQVPEPNFHEVINAFESRRLDPTVFAIRREFSSCVLHHPCSTVLRPPGDRSFVQDFVFRMPRSTIQMTMRRPRSCDNTFGIEHLTLTVHYTTAPSSNRRTIKFPLCRPLRLDPISRTAGCIAARSAQNLSLEAAQLLRAGFPSLVGGAKVPPLPGCTPGV